MVIPHHLKICQKVLGFIPIHWFYNSLCCNLDTSSAIYPLYSIIYMEFACSPARFFSLSGVKPLWNHTFSLYLWLYFQYKGRYPWFPLLQSQHCHVFPLMKSCFLLVCAWVFVFCALSVRVLTAHRHWAISHYLVTKHVLTDQQQQ